MDSKDITLPADWAIEEALRRVNKHYGKCYEIEQCLRLAKDSPRIWAGIIIAASLIQQHEQPPVDPDVEAVKRILEAYAEVGLGDWYWESESTVKSLTRAVTQYKQEVQNRG